MAHRIPGLALIFPGQGSQAAGMGKELAFNHVVARRTFEEADEALGYPLSQLCFEGPDDKLRLTEITQPAILTVSVAAARVLADWHCSQLCRGSLAGRVLCPRCRRNPQLVDAVRAVRNRGKYMQEAVPVGVGAMAAILVFKYQSSRAAC